MHSFSSEHILLNGFHCAQNRKQPCVPGAYESVRDVQMSLEVITNDLKGKIVGAGPELGVNLCLS